MKGIIAACLGYGVLGIFLIALIVALVFGLYAFSAWLLTLVWGVAIPAVVPGLVASGSLPATLTFWPAFCIIVLLNLIGGAFKSRTTVNKG